MEEDDPLASSLPGRQEVSASRLISRLRAQNQAVEAKAAGTLAHLRLSESELEALIELVRQKGGASGPWAPYECGAFVLVAGRILCEGDVARVYSWKPVWQRLGWDEPLPTKVYEIVDRGFRFWGLKPHRFGDKTAWVASTILLGGLPVEWLDNPNHEIGQFVRRLLALAGKLEVAPSAVELSPGQFPDMATLQNSNVVALCKLLADELWTLRARLPAGRGRPSEAAATLGDDWRDSFPIQWTAAADFDHVIDSLFAVADAGGSALTWLKAESFLRAESKTVLRRLGLVAQRIGEDALPADLRTAIPEDITELLVSAVEPSGLRPLMGRLERRGNRYAVIPTREWVDVEGSEGVAVVFHSRGEVIGATIPPGAEELDEEAPWCFDAEDRKKYPGLHKLLGWGDLSTSRHKVWLSCPEGALPSGDSVSHLSIAASGGRDIWEVSGRASVRSPDDIETFSVATGAEDIDEWRLTIRGPTWRASGSRRSLWLGAPIIDRVNATQRIPIQAAELEWRPRGVNGARWRSWIGQTPVGDVDVRVRTPEQRLLRTRLAVLPANFEVRLGGKETLEVVGTGLLNASGSGTACRRLTDASIALTYCAEEIQRAEIEVQVIFQNGSALTLDLPLPTAPCGFADLGGRWLPFDTHLSVPRLEGVRVITSGSAPHELVLRGDPTIDATGWEVLVERCPPAMYLDQLAPIIDARLRGLSDLDARVDLSIRPVGQALRQLPRLSVGHYGFSLSRSEGGQCYSAAVAGRVGALESEIQELALFGLPLAAPSEEARAWPSLDDGSWCQPPLEPGPWLLYAESGGWVRSRPVLHLVWGASDDLVSRSWGSARWANVASIPDRDDRTDAWKTLFTDMSRDVFHPDWKEAWGVLSHARRLPASAFDAIHALRDSPNTLALLLLHQVSAERLADHVAVLQEVGFLPGMIPLSSWGHAFRRLQAAVAPGTSLARTLGSPEAAFAQLASAHYPLEPSAGPATPVDFIQALTSLASATLTDMPGPQCPAPPAAWLDSERNTADIELRRKAADNRRWPPLTFGLPPEELEEAIADLDGHPQYTRSVLAAPRILAELPFSEDGVNPQLRRDVLAARIFDPVWFDKVHQYTFALLLEEKRAVAQELFRNDQ